MTLDEFAYETEDIKVPTFIVPVKYCGIINGLDDKQAGELFKALFQVAQHGEAWNKDGDFFFNSWQQAIFEMMKIDIVTDSKKYRRMVIKNRQNAEKGGSAKRGYKKK